MFYNDIYQHTVAMLDDGISPAEIAEALHIDFQLVLDILQDFESSMRAYG